MLQPAAASAQSGLSLAVGKGEATGNLEIPAGFAALLALGAPGEAGEGAMAPATLAEGAAAIRQAGKACGKPGGKILPDLLPDVPATATDTLSSLAAPADELASKESDLTTTTGIATLPLLSLAVPNVPGEGRAGSSSDPSHSLPVPSDRAKASAPAVTDTPEQLPTTLAKAAAVESTAPETGEAATPAGQDGETGASAPSVSLPRIAIPEHARDIAPEELQPKLEYAQRMHLFARAHAQAERQAETAEPQSANAGLQTTEADPDATPDPSAGRSAEFLQLIRNGQKFRSIVELRPSAGILPLRSGSETGSAQPLSVMSTTAQLGISSVAAPAYDTAVEHEAQPQFQSQSQSRSSAPAPSIAPATTIASATKAAGDLSTATPAADNSSALAATAVVSGDQPGYVAADLQPVLLPRDAQSTASSVNAPSIAASSASNMGNDFATLVDRLIEARDLAMPQTVRAALQHAEFGQVSLNFRADDNKLTVSMTSADPDFAPAVQAAAMQASASTDGNGNQRQEAQSGSQQHSSGATLTNQPQTQSQGSFRNGGSDGNGAVTSRSTASEPDSGQGDDEQQPGGKSGIYA